MAKLVPTQNYSYNYAPTTCASAETLIRQREQEGPDYVRFERMKQDYQRANPDATPAEYDRAVAGIARECGV